MSKRHESDAGIPHERRRFRDNLLQRMNGKKLSGAELARRAKLSKDAISSYTTMRSLPTPKTLATLAKILECKPQELLPDSVPRQSVVEVRDSDIPGFKLLIVRLPLPMAKAFEFCSKLSELEHSPVVREALANGSEGAHD